MSEAPRDRMLIPAMMAGILDLACKAGEDAERAAGFAKVFTRPDEVYVSQDFAQIRLRLPEYEEIRMILGLASPRIVGEAEQDELIEALRELARAGERLHRIVRRDYYSDDQPIAC